MVARYGWGMFEFVHDARPSSRSPRLGSTRRRRAIGVVGATALLVASCANSTDSGNDSLETVTQAVSSNAEVSTDVKTPANTSTPSATPAPPATAESSSAAGMTPLGVADINTKTQRQSNGAGLVVTGVRVGKHDTFDRIVFDLQGTGAPGWFVEYTDNPAQQGSGHSIEYAGDTAINLNIDGTLMPFELGMEDPQLGTTQGTDQVVTEVISQGTFEGRSQFVIGVRGPKHPFSVQVLQEPTRLVVDIHRS